MIYRLLIVATLVLGGCGFVQDTTEIVGKTYVTSQEIDVIKEDLSPYIENQQALVDLESIQRDTELLLLGNDLNKKTLWEILNRSRMVYLILSLETDERWEELSLTQQYQIRMLDNNILDLYNDIEKYLNGNVEAIEIGKKFLDFGYYATQILQVYKGVK